MPLAQTRLETLQICKLLQCVREEERVQIEKLTLNGVPHLINYNEPTTGETALSTAAAANNDSMIEYLIELGAYPDVKDFDGRTAVMRAAELGNIQCVEALAKAECNMKLTDNNGKGVLFYCISPTTRHDKCMQIVIEHGADVNNISKDTCPVFLAACEIASQAEKSCLNLLGKGADPNSKNEKTNRTALMAACASGSVKVVRSILEGGGEIDVVMLKSKVHAAHEAARGGFLDVLMVLAAFGANFDQYDEKGNTPIHYAAQTGHAMCCKYLSQRGCNPKPKNDEGLQAKGVSKENGHKEATKECKKAEKSFGKGGKNNDPWALRLYDFCSENEEQLREMFVKYDTEEKGTVSREDFLEVLQNMNVPMPDESEMKTLLIAHDNKNKDGVIDYNEFLLGKKYVNKQYLRSAFEPKSKKKKKGGKGKKGKTKIPLPICTQVEGSRAADGGPPPEYIPRHDHYTDLGRFSRDQPPEHPLQDDSGWYLHHPERTYMRLNDAAKHNDLNSMTGVFEKNKALVDTKDRFYKTPLMIACLHGNLQVTKFLVENGANLQSEDNFRWTPLHFACHSGMYDVIEYLVDKGANIDAVTMNGATPFMRAIESSRPEIVQYLLEKGVKVQTETRKGHTPMDLAAAWADARVFQIVKAKWDSLPPPPDKKDAKKGAAKKGGGAKRPGSSSPAKALANTAPDSPDLDLPGHHRKGSILRAASALAGGIEEVEDITFTPIKRWTEQPTSEALIHKRVEQRDRFGWEVDFEDFQMPLLKNVYARVEVFGGVDAD